MEKGASAGVTRSEWVNLREAYLRNINFSHTNLRGANLIGADLSGANLIEAYLFPHTSARSLSS